MTNDQRAGADAWIAGTYDPKLRLTYWGTGQAKAGKTASATSFSATRRSPWMSRPARSNGTSSPRPTKAWISTKS